MSSSGDHGVRFCPAFESTLSRASGCKQNLLTHDVATGNAPVHIRDTGHPDMQFARARVRVAVTDSYLFHSEQRDSTKERSEWRCNSNLVRRDSEYCCSATNNMQRLRYYFAAPAVTVRIATISR